MGVIGDTFYRACRWRFYLRGYEIPGDITMSNFLDGYMYIYLVCEDILSYYQFGSILLGPYATIAVILALGILGPAMSRWLDGIHIGGNNSTFCQIRCRAHWRCRIGCEFVGLVVIVSASSIIWT